MMLRFVGIRKLFLHVAQLESKEDGSQTLEDCMSDLWDRGGDVCHDEWHFHRKFAAACVADNNISLHLEDVELKILVLIRDRQARLSVVEQLLCVANAE
jgi:hypothetical protein